MARTYYTLPWVRFTNFARLLVFLDGCASAALWLTGGHDQYLESSVLKWTITGSVFELACIGIVKMSLLFYAFTKLEDLALAMLEDPYMPGIMVKKRNLHISTVALSLACLAYASVKGGLVLNALLNDPDYAPMHITYNALVISAAAFSLVEFLTAVLGPMFLRRLQVIRIKHEIPDDSEKKEEEPKANLRRLFGLAKPEWLLILIGMLSLIVSSGAAMAAPLFFGFVIDAATHKSMAAVNHTVLMLFFIFVGGSIASLLRSWSFTLAGYRVVCRIRRDLFASIIRQEVAFFDTNRTGELTNRLSSDTAVLQNAVTVNVSMLVRYLVQILGSIVIMFTQSAALTGVLLSVVPVVAIGAVQYGNFMKNIQKNFQDALGSAGTVAEESISSIRTVRSFSGEKKSQVSYDKEIALSYKHGKSLATGYGIFNGLVGIISQGAIALVLWYGGKLVHLNVTSQGTQGISVGILTAFMLYTLNVAMAFAFLASLYGDFMKAVGASIRIFDLMDRQPQVNNEGGQRLMEFIGELEFNDVHFRYPSRPDNEVLKGVSFSMKPGQVIALVGPSGGGKSTIVNLIERFYEPGAGSIKLDGVDLSELDPTWFRRKISMVSQEPSLFACSIKENIAYGKNAMDEEIEQAAKMANAHDFISSFEEGYETLVGERGVRLSGANHNTMSEWSQNAVYTQSLGFEPIHTRSFTATSALDAESEHLVQEAIDRAMVGRTVLIIAHRLSTVRNASQVLVISHGRIAEKGTHDELVNKEGIYKKLVLRQLSAAGGAINSIPDDLIIDDETGDVIELANGLD
ncbi:ABC transporter B family member 1-like [Acanthaster planci]|uniref:ABC transporter B family member 1-like n=1 Tax=Acanthaster planci TaxID=133434 RepID=A0A8B7Y0V6_ACAPL|nr:ABC transporter B family member 1-like [Acanthaster planci]